MAFLAFTISLIIGLTVDNSFVTIVARSLVVMFIFYILGCIFAAMGQKVIEENFEHEVEELNANETASNTGEPVQTAPAVGETTATQAAGLQTSAAGREG